jgi:hypothetical protein
MKFYAKNFGSHLPMKLTIERNLLAQDFRPMGERSNFRSEPMQLGTRDPYEQARQN